MPLIWELSKTFAINIIVPFIDIIDISLDDRVIGREEDNK